MYKILRFWIAMLIILAAIYFYLYKYHNIQENFTPRLNLFVRPHLRNMRLNYETFKNNYGSDFIINKLKKMNIY
jgi:hypothetical protein